VEGGRAAGVAEAPLDARSRQGLDKGVGHAALVFLADEVLQRQGGRRRIRSCGAVRHGIPPEGKMGASSLEIT